MASLPTKLFAITQADVDDVELDGFCHAHPQGPYDGAAANMLPEPTPALNMRPQELQRMKMGSLRLLNRLASMTADVDKPLAKKLAQVFPYRFRAYSKQPPNAEAQPGLLPQLIEEKSARGWVVEVAGGESKTRQRNCNRQAECRAGTTGVE